MVAVLSTFALVAAACNDDAEPPVDEVELTSVGVQLAFLPGGKTSWLNLAVERGYFEEEGLDVTVTPGEGGVAALRNLDIGEFDFVSGVDLSAGMTLRNEGSDVTGIMVEDAFAPYGLQSFAEKDITEPKDFEGHSVGLEAGSIGEQIFEALARLHDVDLDRVERTAISPDLYVSAFLEGDIDLVSGFYADLFPVVEIQAEEQGIELNSVWARDWGIDTYGGMIWTKGATLESEPEMVRAFLRAAKRGMDAGEEDSEAAVAATVDAFEAVNPEIAERQWNYWLEQAKDDTIQATGFGCADTDKMQRSVDTFAEAMGLEVDYGADEIFTNEFMDWCES